MTTLMKKPDDPLTPDPEGNGGTDPPPEDPKPTSPASQDPPTPTGDPQSPFTSDAFKGKSEAELVELFGVYEATVKEQGVELTRLNTEVNKPVEPEPQVTTDEISAEDFWKNPSKSVREVVEGTVRNQLQEIIQPFRDDLASGKTDQAWRDAGSRHSDLDQYRPMINALLSKAGTTDPSFNEIEQYYYMAVGFTSKNESGTPTPAAPPQHAPSSHPILPSEVDKPKPRELDENERTLARLSGQTPEEYLRLQALDEREVLTVEKSDD